MSADVVLIPADGEALTDGGRRDYLIRLARQCTEIPYEALATMLGRWAHKSLSPERRAGLFEAYRRSAEAAEALAGGVAAVSEFFDDGDLPSLGGDVHDLAAELLADRWRVFVSDTGRPWAVSVHHSDETGCGITVDGPGWLRLEESIAVAEREHARDVDEMERQAAARSLRGAA